MKDKVLPQNSRVIPASLPAHVSSHKKAYLIALISMESIAVVTLICVIVFLFLTYTKLQQERVGEEKSLNAWEKLAVRFPNYPQVYFNAALHAQRLGDSQKALEYINKALILNPNLEGAQALRRDILE
jgi:tetratricopeptide (TPR) repeat protein